MRIRKLASDKSIDDTHLPGIREALMDSGVSILNLSASRKEGVEPAWVYYWPLPLVRLGN